MNKQKLDPRLMDARNAALRERTAVALSRIGWGFAVLGFLLLLVGVPSAIYGLVGSHTSRWAIALFGLCLCLIGLALGVLATLIGRGRHF